MKYDEVVELEWMRLVAPHWGAWIEIRFGRCRKRM